jgi:hypoxanthine phosphoribosyltransferase
LTKASTRLTKAFSATDIERRVAALAAELRDDAGEGPIFLLGILNGASCIVTDLLRRIHGDVGYGFIDVVRDASHAKVDSTTDIDFLSWIDIRGRNVYVVKDVVATGVIETYLMAQLRQRNPNSLKLIALLDRPAARTIDLTVDFRAFEAAEGAYAGYGLEIDGRHGNLPYIAVVK